MKVNSLSRRLTTGVARTALVAGLPGLVLAGGFFYLYWIANPNAFGHFNVDHHVAERARPGHGYRIATTLFLFGAVSCTCVAIAWSQLVKRNSRRKSLIAATGGLVTAGSMWLVEAREPLYSRLGARVYDVLLTEDGNLALMIGYVHVGNTMAAVAIWAIVVGGVDLLRELEEEQHERVLDEVHTLLVASSALLAAGVVFMHAWMSWPLAYLKPDSELAAAFSEVVTWATRFVGVVFGVMLVAYFVALARELETWGHQVLRVFRRRWTWYVAVGAPLGVQIALQLAGFLLDGER